MEHEIILAIISIVVLAIGLLYLEKANRMKATGKRAASVIVKNNYKPNSHNRHGVYFPVVQFITNNNEHITQELNIGYNQPQAEGSTINILYDPKNPQDVQIDSVMHLTYLPWTLTTAGLCGIILLCFELFDITNIV